ncbi:9371_t:CDS:2 [Ambispora gerdemannii]|uniref:9371_t:CDS:1 n=1 Tax=Ambispora gerdemannii TaxID=144530 RepID=A0A9N9DPG0_9GLOM|nr:9371_t:CDS:2 [Ambispora gerdemannii]
MSDSSICNIIRYCPNLKHLDVMNCQISEFGIHSCSNIEYLDIACCSFIPESTINKTTNFVLNSNILISGISNETIKEIAHSCPNLNFLIWNTKISMTAMNEPTQVIRKQNLSLAPPILNHLAPGLAHPDSESDSEDEFNLPIIKLSQVGDFMTMLNNYLNQDNTSINDTDTAINRNLVKMLICLEIVPPTFLRILSVHMKGPKNPGLRRQSTS